MASMTSKKHVLTTLVALGLMLTAALYALAQQAGDAKKGAAEPAIGRRHTLAATLETVQWAGSIRRSRLSSPSTPATPCRSRR